MIYNAVDGTVLSTQQEFLDDLDNPILPKPGYPKVKLQDSTKATLSSVLATPSTTPGTWVANVSIPDLGITEKQELRLVWFLKDSGNDTYKITDTVIVEPKTDYRYSDVVALFGESTFNFVLPMHFGTSDTGVYQIYDENTPVLTVPADLAAVATLTRSIDRTSFTVPLNLPDASLVARFLKVDVTPSGGVQRSFSYKLWAITPSIMLAMSHLEDFLNKSRIENVIPELQYTPGDLVGYLERGLYLFNTVGQPTYFTGLNMQGILFDCWLTTSCYYALGAQLLAEGSLAFDFSGQGIALNVDRTPQLDSALGRIESAINDRIVPMKAKMVKQGVTSGDGSVGSVNFNRPNNHGTVGIINAPTTTLPWGIPSYMGRRRF